jgi:PRTRC genetic system ThiF family protein
VTFVIDAGPVHAAGRRTGELDAVIVLVGCGGTGAFLGESIARLLIGRKAALYVVDPDRVRPENLGRQAFFKSDLGNFKAEVLAQRLVRNFECEVGYSMVPYDARVHAAAFDRSTRLGLVVGAVDNAAARRAIATTLDQEEARSCGWGSPPPVLWLDAGNGCNSGQVLLGNALRGDQLRRGFDRTTGVCRALPSPSLQRPDLLQTPMPAARDAVTCAAAVSRGEQSATINQIMAALVVSYVERLLERRCGWMATYVDLENGTLQCVPAEPKHVASIVGLHVNALVAPTGRRSL